MNVSLYQRSGGRSAINNENRPMLMPSFPIRAVSNESDVKQTAPCCKAAARIPTRRLNVVSHARTKGKSPRFRAQLYNATHERRNGEVRKQRRVQSIAEAAPTTGSRQQGLATPSDHCDVNLKSVSFLPHTCYFDTRPPLVETVNCQVAS